ncbi:hypothetical protein [Hwanghaeella sp. LZ110]|uniref:hypothetical protein n=1 Tax=Hwanghaeella sp. LZ110 TaxID=3402810 RepID=UPI003B67A0F9
MSIARKTFEGVRNPIAAAVAMAGVSLASLGSAAQAGDVQPVAAGIDRTAIEKCVNYMENVDYEKRVFDYHSPCRSLTVGDVASGMNPNERVLFTFDEASRRVYAIGKAKGNDALHCLDKEFLKFPTKDGEREFTRGFKGLIKIIHSAANNGGLQDIAAARVQNGVDWVARKACGVDPSGVTTASLE